MTALPLSELDFMKYKFMMSPSTENMTGTCNLWIEHHKILRSRAIVKESVIPVIGNIFHRIANLYFDKITIEIFGKEDIQKEILAILLKYIPDNSNKKVFDLVYPHLLNFSKHETTRYLKLLEHLGSKKEAFKYFIPLRREYKHEDFKIGILFYADVILIIPKDFYGRNIECLEIKDYKTGTVPDNTIGISKSWKTGETTSIKPKWTEKVEKQIAFESIFLENVNFEGLNRKLKPIFGRVLYTIDNTTLLARIDESMKEDVFKDLKKILWRISCKEYNFNPYWCRKFCQYEQSCMGALDLGEKLEIIRLKKTNYKEAIKKMYDKVLEINKKYNPVKKIDIEMESKAELDVLSQL